MGENSEELWQLRKQKRFLESMQQASTPALFFAKEMKPFTFCSLELAEDGLL